MLANTTMKLARVGLAILVTTIGVTVLTQAPVSAGANCTNGYHCGFRDDLGAGRSRSTTRVGEIWTH